MPRADTPPSSTPEFKLDENSCLLFFSKKSDNAPLICGLCGLKLPHHTPAHVHIHQHNQYFNSRIPADHKCLFCSLSVHSLGTHNAQIHPFGENHELKDIYGNAQRLIQTKSNPASSTTASTTSTISEAPTSSSTGQPTVVSAGLSSISTHKISEMNDQSGDEKADSVNFNQIDSIYSPVVTTKGLRGRKVGSRSKLSAAVASTPTSTTSSHVTAFREVAGSNVTKNATTKPTATKRGTRVTDSMASATETDEEVSGSARTKRNTTTRTKQLENNRVNHRSTATSMSQRNDTDSDEEENNDDSDKNNDITNNDNSSDGSDDNDQIGSDYDPNPSSTPTTPSKSRTKQNKQTPRSKLTTNPSVRGRPKLSTITNPTLATTLSVTPRPVKGIVGKLSANAANQIHNSITQLHDSVASYQDTLEQYDIILQQKEEQIQQFRIQLAQKELLIDELVVAYAASIQSPILTQPPQQPTLQQQIATLPPALRNIVTAFNLTPHSLPSSTSNNTDPLINPQIQAHFSTLLAYFHFKHRNQATPTLIQHFITTLQTIQSAFSSSRSTPQINESLSSTPPFSGFIPSLPFLLQTQLCDAQNQFTSLTSIRQNTKRSNVHLNDNHYGDPDITGLLANKIARQNQ